MIKLVNAGTTPKEFIGAECPPATKRESPAAYLLRIREVVDKMQAKGLQGGNGLVLLVEMEAMCDGMRAQLAKDPQVPISNAEDGHEQSSALHLGEINP